MDTPRKWPIEPNAKLARSDIAVVKYRRLQSGSVLVYKLAPLVSDMTAKAAFEIAEEAKRAILDFIATGRQ